MQVIEKTVSKEQWLSNHVRIPNSITIMKKVFGVIHARCSSPGSYNRRSDVTCRDTDALCHELYAHDDSKRDIWRGLEVTP